MQPTVEAIPKADYEARLKAEAKLKYKILKIIDKHISGKDNNAESSYSNN